MAGRVVRALPAAVQQQLVRAELRLVGHLVAAGPSIENIVVVVAQQHIGESVAGAVEASARKAAKDIIKSLARSGRRP